MSRSLNPCSLSFASLTPLSSIIHDPGAFVEFALEVFPVLYPTYRIPEQGQGESEQILEIFLRARYNKRFQVGATTFWVVNEHERSEHPMPDWARRWAILWGALPTGSLIGKEEILSLLDLL